MEKLDIPLVSVLVTPYNHAAYIRQTLDSILMQRCAFGYEIIIGEDCSTDGTREICMEYAERFPERIVLCLNEQNKGLINNYFDIFIKARGRYIADCGGDDYWLSETRLQEQVELLENHPDVSLVSGNWQLFDQKSGRLSAAPDQLEAAWYEPSRFGPEAAAKYLGSRESPRVVLSASCFRADWAKEAYLQWPEIFRGKEVACEDLPLTAVLLLKGPFYFSQADWLVYRVLEKSLSHSENRYDHVSGFAFEAFRQTLVMADILQLPEKTLRTYVLAQRDEFAYQAFLHQDPELMIRLKALLSRQHRRPGFKVIVFEKAIEWPLFRRLLQLFIAIRHQQS